MDFCCIDIADHVHSQPAWHPIPTRIQRRHVWQIKHQQYPPASMVHAVSLSLRQASTHAQACFLLLATILHVSRSPALERPNPNRCCSYDQASARPIPIASNPSWYRPVRMVFSNIARLDSSRSTSALVVRERCRSMQTVLRPDSAGLLVARV